MIEEKIDKLIAVIEQLTIALTKSANVAAREPKAEKPKAEKPAAVEPAKPDPIALPAGPTDQDLRDFAQKFLDKDVADKVQTGLDYLTSLKKEYGCSVSKVPEDKRAEVLAKMKKKFDELNAL
jgi:hypothetical protein